MSPRPERSRPRLSAPVGLLLWLGLLTLLILLGVWQWQQGGRIQSDILAMLPKVQEDPLAEAALKRMEQKLGNQVYIGLIAKDKPQAIDAGKQLQSALEKEQGAFKRVRSAEADSFSALGRFYFPYRMGLLSDSQRQQLASGELTPLIQNAQQQLYSAFGAAGSELIAEDPLLLFPDWLKSLAEGRSLTQAEGILLAPTPQGQYAAIVMAEGIGSAFNPQQQATQLKALEQALAPLPQDIRVLKAGALFHAAAATESAKSEINRIGLVSLLGVILLVLLAFRSLMPLTVALLTLGSGFLAATVTTLTLFGELHLLTLVFGTSLIGIAIDYSFHFYCERLQHPKASPRQVIGLIFPAVTLALITSVGAYLGIGLAPFPGMQQVAVFCASGLIFTWLTLLLAYPAIAASPLLAGDSRLALAGRLLNLWQALGRRSSLLILVPLGLLLLFGGINLKANDDIRALQSSPPAVSEPENALRQLLSGGTDNQFLLVRGDSAEEMLQRLEQLAPGLKRLIAEGKLGNSVNIARYFPSTKRQQQDHQLQGLIYRQTDTVLDTLGLNAELAGPLSRQWAEFQPLSATDWLASEGAKSSGLSDLYLTPTDGITAHAAIVLLGGIHDLDALKQLASSNPGVQLVDKVADISALMAKYRQLTLLMLALALALAAMIFSWRFGLRRGLWVALVPTLAAILTLGALGWLGSGLTLFHALALVLVFGIGVDYSLFFAEAKQHPRGVMLAVLMSAASTLLAFGLLALSDTYAIAAFGITLALGIGFTLLLAPLTSTLTRNAK
ncbi:MMPL family transporter [Shewanella algae]|uniref:MMPL family transporter n=1 Tax=Shewanella algae TaxID=38313 RepID=UPI0030059A4C